MLVTVNLLQPVGDPHLPENERVKDGEYFLAVAQHAGHSGLIPRVTMRQALPALQNLGWNVDVLAKFLKGNAA